MHSEAESNEADANDIFPSHKPLMAQREAKDNLSSAVEENIQTLTFRDRD